MTMQTIDTKPAQTVMAPAEHVDGDALGDFLNEVHARKGWALAQPDQLNMNWALNALAQAEGWAEKRPDKARELRAEACAMLAYRLM